MAKCSQRTARTRVPPIGKIPVSIAALRTTSTTLAMSTRESRLAEYSSVKCGMMDYSSGGSVSGEVAAHAAVRTIVGLNRVAFAGLDRADERSGQHDLACLEGQAQRRDLVGEPRHAGGGMVEYAGGKPGLFQLAVAIAQRADLRWIGALCYRNGQLEETGLAAGVLNHPATSVAWLANKIAPLGLALEAGQVVLAGSFIRPIETRKGDTIQADYGRYGSVSCYFACGADEFGTRYARVQPPLP